MQRERRSAAVTPSQPSAGAVCRRAGMALRAVIGFLIVLVGLGGVVSPAWILAQTPTPAPPPAQTPSQTPAQTPVQPPVAAPTPADPPAPAPPPAPVAASAQPPAADAALAKAAAEAKVQAQAFDVAARQLEDGLHEQAAKSFADFLAQYPNAERAAEARVLAAHAQAGGLLQKGDFVGAAAAYAKIRTDFPDSPHRFPAVLGEASARFRLGEHTNVVELLTGAGLQPKGASTAADERVVRGVLLLGESQLRLGQVASGLEAVEKLAPLELPPSLAWERQYLRARLQLAAPQNEAALATLTGLLGLSTNAIHVAEVQGLLGEVLERLGRLDDAIASYEKSLTETTPPARRREAQLKVVQLLMTRNRLADASQRIESFLAKPTPETPVDVLRLTLGELRLKDYYALAPEARKGGTNLLWQALSHSDFVLTNAPASEWVGRAYWGRGWSLWELAQSSPERLPEALKAFSSAAEKLPEGEEQATARMKWADCQFQLKDYAGAVTNYWLIIDRYTAVPAVKAALFEPMLYQTIRASLELTNVAGADQAWRRLVDWFPESRYGDRGLLLIAQALTRLGQLAEARTRLADFVKRFSASPLLPEARRAIARTYVQEGLWAGALREIEGWLGAYPDHPGRAEAEFDRAWLYWQSGQLTNAFQRYTNFVAQFPTNALAPQAQLWIGDYYFDQGDFVKAELNYQILFQNTNWAGSDLLGRARLLAGRAAFSREGYGSAKGYFLWLINNLPPADPVVPEALFDLGNTFAASSSADTTNALAHFQESINAFTRVTQQYTNSHLAPLAWGRIGDCHLQLAAADPRRYELATNAYSRVLESPLAGLSARSKAAVGLGSSLEKMARLADSPQRDALLAQALDRYAEVLYEKNRRPGETESADPLWVREAGVAAARVLEAQQRWDAAIKIYQRLGELFPPLRPAMDKRAAAAAALFQAAKP